MEATIKKHFYFSGIRDKVRKQVLNCHECQTMKRGSVNIGQWAPLDAWVAAWEEVHVDTVGPWKLQVNGVNINSLHKHVIHKSLGNHTS